MTILNDTNDNITYLFKHISEREYIIYTSDENIFRVTIEGNRDERPTEELEHTVYKLGDYSERIIFRAIGYTDTLHMLIDRQTRLAKDNED